MATPEDRLGRSRRARRRAEEIAVGQHGVIHLDQALAAGLSRDAVYRLARTGEWRRMMSKVFAAERPLDEWRQRIMAACVWAGPKAAASHRAAGALWELDGVPAGFVEIAVAGTNRSPDPGLVVHRVGRRPPINRIDGIPTTSAIRTLIDLGSVLGNDDLELALEDALRRRLVSVTRLQESLGAVRGRRGTKILRALVAARVDRPRATDSTFEVRLMKLLNDSGLPSPVSQHLMKFSDGTSVRLDFAYPEVSVGIEADSYRWHSGRRAWSKDRTRLNQLSMEGWRIFHVTYEDLAQGCTVLVGALRRILGQQRLIDE